jgi:hypothetical protein
LLTSIFPVALSDALERASLFDTEDAPVLKRTATVLAVHAS